MVRATANTNERMEVAMSAESEHAARFLASAGPLANTVEPPKVVNELMLSTGGMILGRGVLYNIKSQYLSPGAYRLTLERAS